MVMLKEFWTKKTVMGLGMGQFLSLLITSTGFSSSELAKRGINAPTSQSFFNYVLLAFIYGGTLLYRKKHLKAKWYYYIVLGLVGVEGNFLVVKAHQYTSLTRVMLLDCWSIPAVLFLTWFFLQTKYKYTKFIGVIVCVAGLVVVIFSDVHAKDRSGGSNPLKGDLLVTAGSTLYAVSNVSEEYFVTSAGRVELMAMLGLFGAVISAVQISTLERSELQSIHWSAGAALPFVGFASAMFLFYSGVPLLLKVDWMYFIAFATVAVGLLIYSGGDKEEQKGTDVDKDIECSKHFDEETGLENRSEQNMAGNSRPVDCSKNESASVGTATEKDAS